MIEAELKRALNDVGMSYDELLKIQQIKQAGKLFYNSIDCAKYRLTQQLYEYYKENDTKPEIIPDTRCYDWIFEDMARLAEIKPYKLQGWDDLYIGGAGLIVKIVHKGITGYDFSVVSNYREYFEGSFDGTIQPKKWVNSKNVVNEPIPAYIH